LHTFQQQRDMEEMKANASAPSVRSAAVYTAKYMMFFWAKQVQKAV